MGSEKSLGGCQGDHSLIHYLHGGGSVQVAKDIAMSKINSPAPHGASA